jgi:hypothetical protein
MTNKQEILKELEVIQEHLNQFIEDEASLSLYAEHTRVYMARSAQLMGDCEYHLQEAVKTSILGSLDMNKKLSPMIFKKYVESLCSEEQRMFTWCNRINAACTHTIELCRTRISLYKQQIFNN